MLIYLVHRDNGEAWEDYCEYVAAAFDSHEKAVKFIEDEGFDRSEDDVFSSNLWSCKIIDDDDPEYGFWHIEHMWIDKMELQ